MKAITNIWLGGKRRFPAGYIFTAGELSDSELEELLSLGCLKESESKPLTVADALAPATTSNDDEPVSILDLVNTGTAKEISEIKGVGEKTAKALVTQREQSPFESLDRLKELVPSVDWDNPVFN